MHGIKRIEFDENGKVKAVEYFAPPSEIAPPQPAPQRPWPPYSPYPFYYPLGPSIVTD